MARILYTWYLNNRNVVVIFKALEMCLKTDMPRKSREFVKRMFTEYYQELEFCAPVSIESREFGFLTFDEQCMLRHICFKSGNDLKFFLEKTVPSNAYYSCAYYEQPDAVMDEKGWLGADLIFDIDADHIPTSCAKIHDEWTCTECNFVGKGSTPEKCPLCGGQKFEVKTWSCETCLASAKAETVKLLDILLDDFGFSEEETHVFFSGHRGYHVHIESEAFRTLNTVARKEIVDYVLGLGLDTSLDGKKSGRTRLRSIPCLHYYGWHGRLARGMYNFILQAKPEDYKNIGLKKNIIGTIIQSKDRILKSWGSVKPYDAVKGVGIDTWKRIIEFCRESQSAKIDTVVTTDVHRLIRLTSSLHGKTGLKKAEFPVSDIEAFDPFKSAVAFKNGSVTVFVSGVPEFRLGDEAFGPYKNRKVELPIAAALLLICKNRAEIAE